MCEIKNHIGNAPCQLPSVLESPLALCSLLSRKLCPALPLALLLLDLLHVAQALVQQEDGVVDQEVEEPEEERRRLALDLLLRLLRHLTQPLLEGLQLPDVLDHIVHRSSVRELLLKLH